MARLDHVVFAVTDLDRAAARLFEDHGLEAQPGGMHDAAHGEAGTANMLVPLGDGQALELLAVTNPESKHPIVQSLLRALVDGDRLLNFALATDDIESESARLGEPVFDGGRPTATGDRVSFRLTGVNGIVGKELLPWWIQWPAGGGWLTELRPARHRTTTLGISGVEYGGIAEHLAHRINDRQFPIQVTSGRPGLAAVWIRTNGQKIEIRA